MCLSTSWCGHAQIQLQLLPLYTPEPVAAVVLRRQGCDGEREIMVHWREGLVPLMEMLDKVDPTLYPW